MSLSLTSLWRNFDQLFFTTLFQIIDVCRYSFMRRFPKVPFKLSWGLGSANSVDFLLCLGSLSCCTSQFGLSISCQKDGLTFDYYYHLLWYTEEFMINSMTVRCLGPVAAEQAHIIILPLTYWYEVFVHYTVAKLLYFGLTCPKGIVAEVLHFFRGNFANLNHAAIFFWERKGFPLAAFLNKPTFFSLLLIVLSWTLKKTC